MGQDDMKYPTEYHVLCLVSIPSHCTMGWEGMAWDILQRSMLRLNANVHPVPLYHGKGQTVWDVPQSPTTTYARYACTQGHFALYCRASASPFEVCPYLGMTP